MPPRHTLSRRLGLWLCLLATTLGLALSHAADPAPTAQATPHAPAPAPAPADLPPLTPEGLRNRPILSAPLLDRKRVVAHYMTAWLAWEEAPAFARDFTPVPPGGPADVAGTLSGAPLWALVRDQPLLDLEAAVRHELAAAVQAGIDGFQFFYPIHMHDGFLQRYSLVVRTFIKQAERHYPDFRVSLCLCAPTQPSTEPAMRAQWAKHIRWILADTADSPVWLRSPDGRLLFYTWVPEGIVDAFRAPNPPHIHHEAGIAATAVAYETLAREIGQPIAWIFHMRGRADDDYANTIFDYFPAAWRWTDGDTSADTARLVALAQARGRVFSPSIYPGFYGHTYREGAAKGNGSGVVGRDPIAELWRPYMKTRQTALYRSQLTSAFDSGSPLVSVITWNDQTEATQLAPDANYGFSLGLLLRYYRNIWLGHPERNDREIALVAFKKHRVDATPATDVRLRVMNPRDPGDLADENATEVLTILTAPATLLVNGVDHGSVPAGLHATRIPFAAGPHMVQVVRDGAVVLSLAPSEWSTDAPRRTDPVSVIRSTEDDRLFRDLFGPAAPDGDATPYTLREYAAGGPAEVNARTLPLARPADPDGTYTTAKDIAYRAADSLPADQEPACRLDLYYPTAPAAPYPTVVWFHGGGMTGGKRWVPKALQQQGIAVVAVDYRLYPTVKAPAYIEDAAAAVAWTLRHIADYGGDPSRVYVSGHSAGGYLASMVVLDKHYLASHDIDADTLAGLAPFSGHAIDHMTVRRERGISIKIPTVTDLAPLFHIRKDAPPILLLTADRELELLGRYEEVAYLWRMLKVVGHPHVTLTELPGFTHGNMVAPGCPQLLRFIRETAPQPAARAAQSAPDADIANTE